MHKIWKALHLAKNIKLNTKKKGHETDPKKQKEKFSKKAGNEKHYRCRKTLGVNGVREGQQQKAEGRGRKRTTEKGDTGRGGESHGHLVL